MIAHAPVRPGHLICLIAAHCAARRPTRVCVWRHKSCTCDTARSLLLDVSHRHMFSLDGGRCSCVPSQGLSCDLLQYKRSNAQSTCVPIRVFTCVRSFLRGESMRCVAGFPNAWLSVRAVAKTFHACHHGMSQRGLMLALVCHRSESM